MSGGLDNSNFRADRVPWTKPEGADGGECRKRQRYTPMEHARRVQGRSDGRALHRLWPGFVIIRHWTTDFVVVHRVLSANSRSGKMAPVIDTAFKMAVPLIAILPGPIALGLHNADARWCFTWCR
jgi:hypothetical protein